MEEQQQILANALDGKGAHVLVHDAFDGFDLTLAEVKPQGASHSVWDILNHLNYWTRIIKRRLSGASGARCGIVANTCFYRTIMGRCSCSIV